jgi:hypothetical protein
MQPFTQKYTIVQFFEDIPESAKFAFIDWPLHSTIADVFAIDWSVEQIIEKLKVLLSSHEQASSVAMDDSFLGSDKPHRVVLLQKTDSLLKLHYDVIQLLEQGGVRFNSPEYVRKGFLPHSTVQKQTRLTKGDQVIFSALSLVDMFPNEDPYQRKVLKTFKLGA